MKIPKKFSLMGKDIRVLYSNLLVADHGIEGAQKDNRIIIQRDSSQLNLGRQEIEHTFCHEMVHSILQAMNEDEMRKNEKFVDVFSALLHQAINSFTGELE